MASAHAVSSEIQIDKVGLRKHYLTLTKCQRGFVRLLIDWIKRPRKLLVVVSGGPGTGKSYVVKNTLDCVRAIQLRMSFTARSAAAIGGQTIHSALRLKPADLADLEKSLANETDLLKSIEQSCGIASSFRCNVRPRVIVVDEISMIKAWLMYWLIDHFMNGTDSSLFFVCMGDPHQLAPIKSIHNLFSITFSETRYEICKIHLTESKRFEPEYGKLINALRKFVDENDATGMFDLIRERFPVVEDIDHLLLMRADRAMACKKETVKTYNKFYLKSKIGGPEILIRPDLVLKPGCLVFVTKNGCSQVNNGTQLLFRNYDPDEDVAMCRDPKTNSEIKVKRDYFNEKFPLELGFAGTIHKYQGDTIDESKIVINFNENKNPNLVYTALSRVRQMEQILAIEL